jgi:hypothetical protein
MSELSYDCRKSACDEGAKIGRSPGFFGDSFAKSREVPAAWPPPGSENWSISRADLVILLGVEHVLMFV